MFVYLVIFFFFKQKTAYEMRISDWSSDVCSSDLIDALFIEYAQHYFAKNEPKAWEVLVQLEAKLNDKNIPRNMIGREKRVVALEQYLSQVRIYDPVLDGLRSAVRYDRTRSEEHTSELQSLMRKSYAVFCL